MRWLTISFRDLPRDTGSKTQIVELLKNSEVSHAGRINNELQTFCGQPENEGQLFCDISLSPLGMGAERNSVFRERREGG